MSYVLRIVQLFLLCLVGGLILIIAAEQPVKAQACKIFNTCGDDNPIKLPSWDDIKREVSNCVSGGCNVPAVVQAEINSCFSGGCDPVKIYQNFDWSSEAFGELGRVLYQAAADVMQEKHAGSQSYWLSSYQKEALRPYFGALVDRVSIIYNGRMMDYLGSIGGKTLPGESNAQTYGLRIYINGSYDERNCAQLTLLAHELAHSRQYEQSGSSLSDFGYHYFKSWARNGFRYGKINFEVEAEDVEAAYYCPADEIDYPEASVGVGGSAGGHNTITPVTSPAEEAAQAINDVLQAGDIAQAVTLYEEAISVLGFDLPESLGKEICRQGLVAGQQTQVHYLCLRTVTGNLKQAQIQTQYASEAHSFLETLLRHLPQFQLTNQGITTRSMADALTRPDAGLRINATVERVWGDWLPYGPRTVQTDPATQNLTPLRILVIRLIQGRQLTLTTSEQHALYSLLTRADPPENWRNSMNGIIGAINRESFQTVFQTGNSAIADTQSVQATQAEPLLPPQNDPPPPLASGIEPAPAPAGQGTLITDFERFGAWTRGDEKWGVFEHSNERAVSGNSAGKFTYDFPAGAENNYVVFRNPLPIAGEPTALTVQVYGDGSTHFLNAWVKDANGQLWQFTFGRIRHQGWQQLVAPLNLAGGWPNQAIGNPNTTAVAYPVQFYAFVLDGYASDQAFSGSIWVDDLTAITQ